VTAQHEADAVWVAGIRKHRVECIVCGHLGTWAEGQETAARLAALAHEAEHQDDVEEADR
jgi:hypothetical protein